MDGSHETNPAASPPATTTGGPTGEWPRIADFWPDAPHRMSPEADYYPGDDPAEATAPPPYPNQAPPSRLIGPPPAPAGKALRFLLGLLAVTVFLGGSVIVLARMVLGGDGTSVAVTTPPAADPQPSASAAPNPPVSIAPQAPPSAGAPAIPSATTRPTTAPADPPFSSGTFELGSDLAVLIVSVAAIGADPVRVSVPAGSGIKPRLDRDGSTVRLTAKVAEDAAGTDPVTVRLNSRITWSVKMTGGVRDARFSLADGWVRRIDLTGGAARIDMSLPTPGETLPIRMTGGVNTWNITTAKEVPVRVLLRDGGGRVTLNGDRTRGIDRYTRLRADGRDDVESGGLDIEAVAGIGALTVAPAGGTG
ncbi:hypothetical protein ACFQS1_23910 [Paractinoplanes rhizophilus]|uniref:DUF4115 domain-containing protein n=1 Tax=Paractinoplanes rhizophilus TaxID=1416877 RepID=A0ABW2HXW3_9ACTN